MNRTSFYDKWALCPSVLYYNKAVLNKNGLEFARYRNSLHGSYEHKIESYKAYIKAFLSVFNSIFHFNFREYGKK
jgi:hypothetical protein